MDVVTQGLLGGVMAQSVARPAERRLAALCGVTAGLLADADVLIRSETDPLLALEYHRHFTHSLFFIPFGAAIAMLLLWPFLRRRLPASRLYLYCLLGFSMSGLLDACTTYGTQLLWPLSDQRIAFNIISIVDPLFTLILLVTFVSGLWQPGRQFALAGLGLCAGYLALGLVQNQRALQMAEQLSVSRGHQAVRHIVKPTLGNLVLWRSVYLTGQRIHVDALRVGWPGRQQVFAGESVARFAAQRDLPGLGTDTTLYADIQRFAHFSDGVIGIDPRQPEVLGDMRYSMLPTSARPLWGIVIDRNRPQAHAEFRFFRDNSPAVRQTFVNLLLGRCAAADCESATSGG